MASKQLLTDALKVRLIIDNPTRLKLVQWVDDEWAQLKLNVFYNDEDVMDNAIFETTQAILAAEGKTLPGSAADTLRNDVSLGDTPLVAAGKMFIAAGKATSNP